MNMMSRPDWAISTESCKEVEYSPKLVIDIPAGRFEIYLVQKTVRRLEKLTFRKGGLT